MLSATKKLGALAFVLLAFGGSVASADPIPLSPDAGMGWSSTPWFSDKTKQDFREMRDSFRDMKNSLGIKPKQPRQPGEPEQPNGLQKLAATLKRTRIALEKRQAARQAPKAEAVVE